MKKMKLLKLLIAAFAVSVAISSCKKDDDDKPVTPPVVTKEDTLLLGEITANKTIKAGYSYILSGGVHVKSGVTLTIEPGAVIKSDPAVTTQPYCYLMIEQGAKIMAEGTKEKPITFTSGSSTPMPGDWGGIIINGYAPANVANAQSEIGSFPYGGTNAADNSGILKYVIVEYGGAKITDTKEHNGFTFNGVGNGTTVDYIQAWNGTDDGIECFGGTVNMKHVVSWNNTDDGFDWTFGWSGKVQYLLVKVGVGGDRCIEADNNENDNTASPYSNPTIINATMIGSNTQNEENSNPQGVELRRGTKGKFYNFIICNTLANGVRISDGQTNTNVNDGSLEFDYSKIHNTVSYKVMANITDTTKLFENGAGFMMSQDLSAVVSDYKTVYTGGINASTIDAFFTSDDKIGALSTDWTANWIKK